MFKKIRRSIVKRSINEIKDNFNILLETDLHIDDDPFFMATIQATIYGKVFFYRKFKLQINQPIEISGRGEVLK